MYKTSYTYGNFYQCNIYKDTIKYLEKTKVIKETSNSQCQICHNNMKNCLIRILPCNHKYHIECVDQWLFVNLTCPLCRKII